MSDEYHYTSESPLEEKEIEETLEDKFKEMTDAQFENFYKYLMQKLGCSRHASPHVQVWHVLSVDRIVIYKLLAEVESKRQ